MLLSLEHLAALVRWWHTNRFRRAQAVWELVFPLWLARNVRLPAGWRSTGDDYGGCSRYAHPGSIKHTLSSTQSLAHAGWLSHLYASHPCWPYRRFPAGLRLLAYSLPQWVRTHAGQCARPCASWTLYHVLCQSLYDHPGALYPYLRGDCAAHCHQEARSMGATWTELFSHLVFRL